MAGVKIGAVADVLKDMLQIGEGRDADPARTLSAHVRHGQNAAVHRPRHGVTANSGDDHAVLGHDGGAIVRAARAKIWCPREDIDFGQIPATGDQRSEAFGEIARCPSLDQSRHEGFGHHDRIDLPRVGKQDGAVLVALPDHTWGMLHGPRQTGSS